MGGGAGRGAGRGAGGGAGGGAGLAGGGAGCGAGCGAGLAGGVLALELCAPLLLLCWLCCWPDDASDSTTPGKHPQRPVLAHVHESHSRRRSSDLFGRRVGSSAVSLHLPTTSGYKKSLSAHRSHEEIGRHRKLSVHEVPEPETRYHSAPSVIDEVLHRRDWERSSKELHIPLKPEQEIHSIDSSSSESPEAPHATPESSSIEGKSEEQIVKPCKKHHTNIKCSKRKKEKQSTDIKDDDATEVEPSNFYIGEHLEDDSPVNKNNVDDRCEDVHTKSIYKAKDDKQSFNEFIRSKERPRLAMVDEQHPMTLGFSLGDVIQRLDQLLPDTPDRSGATHHSVESSTSLSHRDVFPPPSVEPVGYDGGACYLRAGAARGPGRGGPGAGGPGALRARHASDGDILAPPQRPESGAFSESDLDLELEGAEERPPPYEELQQYAQPDNKETAI